MSLPARLDRKLAMKAPVTITDEEREANNRVFGFWLLDAEASEGLRAYPARSRRRADAAPGAQA